MSLENVSVTDHGYGRFSAAWELESCRFHVWFDPRTLKIDGDGKHRKVLFKNPTVGKGDPDYFETRRLDADKPGNAKAIELAFAEIAKRGLIAAAIAEQEKKEATRLAKAAKQAAIYRAKEAGPDLLQALEACVQRISILTGNCDGSLYAARAAIAKAKP